MDFSKISYSQVQAYADQLKTSSTSMKDVLDEITLSFNQIGSEDVWSGTAASEAKAEFDKLSARFHEFNDAVAECSAYLTGVVTRAKELDAKISGQQ